MKKFVRFFSRLFKIIQAEIKKLFRKRKFKIFLLIFVIFIFLSTSFLFYFRWSRKGSLLIKSVIVNNLKTIYKLKKLLKIYDLPYSVYYFSSSQIPRYDLSISDKNLEKLNQNLPQTGMLQKKHKKTVKADFQYKNRKYSVKVRYRGDKKEHWMFDKKSWRINFGKDKLEDKKSINLILPQDRDYLTEAFSFYIAKKLNLFSLENDFVELYINDKYEGVYLMVEDWDKEAIEKNRLDSDTNLYGEENFERFPDNLYTSVDNFQKYVSFSEKPKDDKSDLEILFNYLNNASDEEFYQKIETILDMDNFLTWQAHSALFFSYASDYRHNANFIFNRDKNKIQFIPWDIGAKDPDSHEMVVDYNPLVKRILAHPYFLCQRNKILLDYINKEEELEDDLNYLDDLYKKTRTSFYKDRKKNFLNIDFDFRVKKIKTWPAKAREKIKEELADTEEICQKTERPTK